MLPLAPKQRLLPLSQIELGEEPAPAVVGDTGFHRSHTHNRITDQDVGNSVTLTPLVPLGTLRANPFYLAGIGPISIKENGL